MTSRTLLATTALVFMIAGVTVPGNHGRFQRRTEPSSLASARYERGPKTPSAQPK